MIRRNKACASGQGRSLDALWFANQLLLWELWRLLVSCRNTAIVAATVHPWMLDFSLMRSTQTFRRLSLLPVEARATQTSCSRSLRLTFKLSLMM